MKKMIVILVGMIPSLVFSESGMLEHATKNGMSDCYGSAKKVADYLLDGKVGTNTSWSSTRPEYLEVAVAETFNDGTPNISTATIVKHGEQECFIKITKITTYKESCAAVPPEYLKKLKYYGVLQKEVTVYEGTNGANRYLAEAEGGGCVVMHVESLFESIGSKK